MPQSTPERRARWVDDSVATDFLKARGYILTRDWFWKVPIEGLEPNNDEWDAILYLIEEWDFGGLDRDR